MRRGIGEQSARSHDRMDAPRSDLQTPLPSLANATNVHPPSALCPSTSNTRRTTPTRAPHAATESVAFLADVPHDAPDENTTPLTKKCQFPCARRRGANVRRGTAAHQDAPIKAIDILVVVIAQKLKKQVSEVPLSKSIKNGKSTLQNEILGDLGEADYRLTQCQEESKALGEEEREIKNAYGDCKKRHDAVIARRKQIGDEKKRIASLQNKLCTPYAELSQSRLTGCSPAWHGTYTTKREAQEKLDQLRIVVKEQAESTQLGLRYLQVGSNKTVLEAMIKERDAEFDAAVKAFQEDAYDKAKADCKKRLDQSKVKLDEVDDDLRETFKEMEANGTAEERDVKELQNELETQRSKLELVIATNPDVIDQYERRKAEIETPTKKIEERERKVARIDKAIKSARDNWQPAVEELVAAIGEKFSAAFDRIGCAGEVELTPHEDYDKWAITIKVKFRDSEQLQQLTAHQDGFCFRLFQGMDQRAERTVHNELVKTTCKEDSGQYFLITPKLLPDLEYHRLMKVLCVNNGEWLPDDSGGNMMSMIKNCVQRRGQQYATIHRRGRPRRRPKSRFPKTIRLFGYDLFGKPPIHLPEDEDEDEDEGREDRPARGRRHDANTLSSSTLDSDAAPLDTSAIQSRLALEQAQREHEARERAERKARRRARKEMKRAALALAAQGGEGAFEGFQGSGGAPLNTTTHGGLPSPFLRSDSSSVSHTDTHASSTAASRDAQAYDDDPDADAADFDAQMYTRRAHVGSGSQDGSGSRSRTTTSVSNSQSPTPATYNHHYLSQSPIQARSHSHSHSQPPLSPTALSQLSPTALAPPRRKKSKSKSSKSSSSKKSSSSATSQSQSLLSPVASQFPDAEPAVAREDAEVGVEFEGFPHDMGLPRVNVDGLGVVFAGGGGGFPSSGLGGPRRGVGKGDMGAFLARRGPE
ncbi:hypothetical protein OF83DRAFT_1082945 [Amylostereum chailletii]|nr:hypothetical protein OF83DRAFT_1082945 [Amylostereum chailletii]